MKIHVDGKEISIKTVNDQDYISLTDMAGRGTKATKTIENWMRTRATLDFLHEWEVLYNPDFNLMKFNEISEQVGRVAFTMSVKEWIGETAAVGIQSRPGRYGGTFAHVDIAFEFGTRISARFKLLLIRDYQRMKNEESRRLNSEWSYSRFLSKVNYSLHTQTIKETLLPRLGKKHDPHLFSNEADMLNVVVFDMTAREFREQFPDLKGNLRDGASIQQLTVLANMESMNAYLIEVGASLEARFPVLCKEAERQLGIFEGDRRLEE